jgi:hypothetical protein
MKTEQKDIEIEIIYNSLSDSNLNAKLDGLAETNGGKFLSFKENKISKQSVRLYSFADEDLFYDFWEKSNNLISRHFGFKILKPEDIVKNMRWSKGEGIYHHAEFLELKDALLFATGFRALYMSFATEDMYDIHIVHDDIENTYFVLYGFPVESEILTFTDEELDEEEIYSLNYNGNTKNDKNKLN